MRTILLFLALLAPLRASAAPAQTGDPLAVNPGERVRLSPLQHPRFGPEQPQPIQGTVSAVRGDTLELRLDGGRGHAVVPLALGMALEISRGIPSRWGSALDSAQRGALQLGLLGPLVGIVSEIEGEPVSALRATGILAAVGAVAGGIRGAFVREERWQRVLLALQAAPGTESP